MSIGTTHECDVLAALGEALSQRIGVPRYQLWFAGKTRLALDGDRLVIGVANHFIQEWLERTFAEDLRGAARNVLGRNLTLRFMIDPELFQAARRREAGKVGGPVDGSVARGSPVEDQRPEEQGLCDLTPQADRPGTTGHGPRARAGRRWRQLADFVVGPCNRVAHASALSLVETPGQGPIPLVLHGSVGTGKTHLLEGIHARLRQDRPDWRLCFVTAEDFTNRFIQAMRFGQLASFRKHFRECEALLLDDLNFLASKRATQEEFLHTLNALLAGERPVAVTCDCHPRLADVFLPELTDRLLGGAIWGLAPPDRDTRLAILKARAARNAPAIPEEVLAFLADQLRGNVRELEGALHTISHFGRVTGRRLDLNLAREAVGDLLRHNVRMVQLADVERAVCTVLGIDSAALHSRQRAWAYCHPRMLAMFLARKHTAATYAEIGQRFGQRNHSTTVAAEKKVRLWIQENATLNLGGRDVPVRDLIERLTQKLLA